MALDNAQFISELSITDPPGTDAVAEGDDHIRTVKRATQQSFPNVDAAVPQTAAQMGQMAIKNEVNTFTQTNLFDARQDTTGNYRFLFSTGNQRGPQWRDSDLDETAWDLVANKALDTLSLRRYVAGVQTDSPIVVNRANGFINFNTIAAAFFAQGLRIETAAVADPAVQTGILFIGGSGTLRWSISRQADDVTGDMVFNRHNDAGTLQDTAFRIAQSDGVATFADRVDLTGGNVRFNNFARADGLQWRHNGAVTWELNAVHSNAPLLRLVFNRYVAGVFQDAPMEMQNDTGFVLMKNLPTTEPAGNPGVLYTQTTAQIDGTERVVCSSR